MPVIQVMTGMTQLFCETRSPQLISPWLQLIVRANPLPFGRGQLLPCEVLLVITPAFAQPPGGGGADIFMSLVPFILIFVIMWFLIIRPQQKRMKEHRELIANVRRGDTIVTSGGLIGKVTKVIDDGEVEAEIAEGVKVRFVKSMIQDVRAKGEPVKDKDKEPAKT